MNRLSGTALLKGHRVKFHEKKIMSPSLSGPREKWGDQQSHTCRTWPGLLSTMPNLSPAALATVPGDPREEAQKESRAPGLLRKGEWPLWAEAMVISALPPKSSQAQMWQLFFLLGTSHEPKEESLPPHNDPHGPGQVFLEHFFSYVKWIFEYLSCLRSYSMID